MTRIAEESSAGWHVGEIEEDVLTGKKTTVASLVAEEGKSIYGDGIVLLVRCNQLQVTEAWIEWDEFLGLSGKKAVVSYRVGESDVYDSRWGISTTSTATFYPGVSAVRFIKTLFGQQEFVARVTPYNENPRTAVFDITGVEEAMMNVRSLCGW